jgi:hypothetical protein
VTSTVAALVESKHCSTPTLSVCEISACFEGLSENLPDAVSSLRFCYAVGFIAFVVVWAQQDSNLRPRDYESYDTVFSRLFKTLQYLALRGKTAFILIQYYSLFSI